MTACEMRGETERGGRGGDTERNSTKKDVGIENRVAQSLANQGEGAP